jgi:hypothetical protein
MNKNFYRESNLSPEEIEELRAKESARLLFEGIEEGEPERAATWRHDPGARSLRLEVSGIQLERIRQEMESDLNLRRYLGALLVSLPQEGEKKDTSALQEIDIAEWGRMIKEPKARFFSGYVKWQDSQTGEQKRVYRYLRSDLIGENAVLYVEGDCPGGRGPEDLRAFQFLYRPESAGGEPIASQHLATFHFGEKYGDFNAAEKMMIGAFLFTLWKRELETLYKKHSGKYTQGFYNDLVEAVTNVINPTIDNFARVLRRIREKRA